MKKIFTILSICFISITFKSYSQQRDTLGHQESEHHRMTRFISQRLNVDSVKAAQIAAVQENYKASLKQLMSTDGLTEDQRHRGVDSLARIKNSAFLTLLTPEQQAKIIPGTERRMGSFPDKKKQ